MYAREKSPLAVFSLLDPKRQKQKYRDLNASNNCVNERVKRHIPAAESIDWIDAIRRRPGSKSFLKRIAADNSCPELPTATIKN
jgi:hypothetical protein